MTGLILKIKKSFHLGRLFQCYIKAESENVLTLEEAASVVNNRRNAEAVQSELKNNNTGVARLVISKNIIMELPIWEHKDLAHSQTILCDPQ